MDCPSPFQWSHRRLQLENSPPTTGGNCRKLTFITHSEKINKFREPTVNLHFLGNDMSLLSEVINIKQPFSWHFMIACDTLWVKTLVSNLHAPRRPSYLLLLQQGCECLFGSLLSFHVVIGLYLPYITPKGYEILTDVTFGELGNYITYYTYNSLPLQFLSHYKFQC